MTDEGLFHYRSVEIFFCMYFKQKLQVRTKEWKVIATLY